MREMEANYKERLAAEVLQLQSKIAAMQQAGAGDCCPVAVLPG